METKIIMNFFESFFFSPGFVVVVVEAIGSGCVAVVVAGAAGVVGVAGVAAGVVAAGVVGCATGVAI